MTYRSDIDGLRAIAVALVILFHAGFATWSGGFVGVDVFFVISGFLITGLLADEARGGRLDLGNFWLRRLRRLFVPAWVVITFCLVAFWFLYPPDYYRDLAESALAQIVFASNFLFFHESGYFDTASHVKPLLHTWSLAVEEQFYLLFPLLALVCVKLWKRLPLWPVALLTIGSFILSVVATPSSPSGAFFLLPTRAWELGVGCCLALYVRRADAVVLPGWARELTAAVGILGIIVVSLVYDTRTPFPSWTAALPVLATALVIWAGQGGSTFVGRLLSWRPIVFVGLISYSLYLWHWPAIVLLRAARSELPSAWENLAAVGVGAVAAWLSYRFLETPVRRRLDLFPNRRLLAGAAVGVAVIAAGAGAIAATGGAPQRHAFSFEQPKPYERQAECFDRFDADGSAVFCAIGRAEGPVDFIAIGDSHNRALLPAIEAMALREGKRGLFASTSGCLPLKGLYMPGDRAGTRKCRRIVEQAYAMAGAGQGKAPVIILTARWSYYTGPARSDGTFKPVSPARDGDASPASSRRAFQRAWNVSMADLTAAGARVIVIDQPPHQPFYPAETAWRIQALGADPDAVSVSRQDHQRDQQVADAIIRSTPGVTVIDPTDRFCGQDRCPMFDGGRSLYFDDDHLSQAGAARMVDLLRWPWPASSSAGPTSPAP
ncbi:MAG: acyltransferase family protein [Caulobacter sp.]